MIDPNHIDSVVVREIPMVRQIRSDETWLEGERRGCCIPEGDPTVRESVCLIILRIGAKMRAAIMADLQKRQDRAESPVADSSKSADPASSAFGQPRT